MTDLLKEFRDRFHGSAGSQRDAFVHAREIYYSIYVYKLCYENDKEKIIFVKFGKANSPPIT